MKHVAFLASRMDPDRPVLNELRAAVRDLGVQLRRPVWVAEHDAPELKGQPPELVQTACLRKVRECEQFICIIDGSYGRRWNDARLCLLELEIMTAAVARKPLHLFLLEPYSAVPEMRSLLNAARLAAGSADIDWVPRTADQILCYLRERLSGRTSRSCWSRHIGTLGHRWRSDDLRRLDVRFLDGQFTPLTDAQPDRNLIEKLLRSPQTAGPAAPVSLINAWMAIRHLCAAPYTDPKFRDFLSLWEHALGAWASAAAWYGLHGHLYLGRLAAVNSLLLVKQQRVRFGVASTSGSIQGTRGAIASEYISIAKTTRSAAVRRALLQRALREVNAALEVSSADPSGLLGIRGTIRQRLGDLTGGVRDYRDMLRIRVDAREDAGRVGEAEVELGFGYLRMARPHLAEGYIVRGVARLRGSGRDAFTVRALRKLAVLYALTLRPNSARRAIDEAHALAERLELEDQLSQIRPLRTLLRWFTAAGPRPKNQRRPEGRIRP